MDFSVGDHVRLADGRTGRITRINGSGHFDVNLDEDAPTASRRGHAALRSNVNQPAAQDDVVYDVAPGDLAKVTPA